VKKIISAIVIIIFLGACSSKQLYTIGDTTNIERGEKSSREFIAIERVELPSYLMDSPIYKKKNPYHLVKIENANWIGNIDKHLTRVVISYLQKSLDNPNIYPYPWSNIDHIDKKISITITKFIAYKDLVTIEANYNILDKKRKTDKNHFFSAKEQIEGRDIEAMLDAMERAYFKLLKDINSKL
jgi:uncharacterized lipoprotein YmbA